MTATTVPTTADRGSSRLGAWVRKRKIALGYATLAVLIMSFTVWFTDQPNLTSPGTFGIALRTATPIALAGLAGLWSERSGTVNIGLEGMMTMGTVMAGWWGWQWGWEMAIVGGLLGGMVFGLLHGLATVTFGVNHIVSGFAINIIAPGVARFMAGELFVGQPGGSLTNSPGNVDRPPRFTLPFLSGGDFLGHSTPDPLGWLADQGWFLVSSVAGLFKGITTDVPADILLAALAFVLTGYVIWRTPFGLRIRAAGERPNAEDSLGVSVYKMRYIGVAISGALAGFGGAVLELFANRYQEGQVAGRGFLGLATLIVGNWRPLGVAAGAGLFGYFQGITLQINPDQLVRSLVLAAALALVAMAIISAIRREWTPFVVTLILAAAGFIAYAMADKPNNQVVYVMPYVVTLIVVAVGGQRLRPPAQAGIPWRKGMQL